MILLHFLFSLSSTKLVSRRIPHVFNQFVRTIFTGRQHQLDGATTLKGLDYPQSYIRFPAIPQIMIISSFGSNDTKLFSHPVCLNSLKTNFPRLCLSAPSQLALKQLQRLQAGIHFYTTATM